MRCPAMAAVAVAAPRVVGGVPLAPGPAVAVTVEDFAAARGPPVDSHALDLPIYDRLSFLCSQNM